jgi:putative DNA primase/helicase
LGWQKGKTLDRDAVTARWGAAKGLLNVGIVYGGDLNVALVDEDGPAGAATMEAWRSDPSKGVPDTVTVISGSGGFHYYLRIPQGWDIRNSTKKVAGGIDLRGTNGFSVAPGSRHWKGVSTSWADGVGIYKWKPGRSPDDTGIADAPVWMLRKMWFATKSRRHETAPDGSTWDDADLGEWETDDDKKEKASKGTTTKVSAELASPFEKA